jgi:hydroxypyruvate reductase
VADLTTCAVALAILRRYGIDVPAAVQARLDSGALETPKPGDSAFAGHEVHLIATPQQSLEAAASVARAAGLTAYILSDEIEGESREVGKVHAALARAVARGTGAFQRPCVILSGGETTVTIRKQVEGSAQGRGESMEPRPGRGESIESRPGRGGRAGEFCLGLAQALQGQPGVWALAADTDGIDGVEDNAGAVVTPDTLARAGAAGLKIDAFLDRNDAYGYFSALGDLLVTGPTHTNVNDFRAILVL